MAAELAGFLECTESAVRMRELGTKIWDANANADYWQKKEACEGPDDLGRIYGVQWRKWIDENGYEIDQLRNIVDRLKTNPTDRRLIVTAWNPGELDQMCLPPCHIMFQFFVRQNLYLDCDFTIRSVDLFLGGPFDIASYALLTHIVAQEVGFKPGVLTMTSKDSHIYKNHVKQVVQQLRRKPYNLPKLILDPNATIDNFHPSMARLEGYKHHPAIQADMAL